MVNNILTEPECAPYRFHYYYGTVILTNKFFIELNGRSEMPVQLGQDVEGSVSLANIVS